MYFASNVFNLHKMYAYILFCPTDLDSFGPSGNALGPPADMADGEIEGRLEFDPKRDLSIDFLQQPLKLN